MASKKQQLHLEKLAILNRGRESKFKGLSRPPFSEEWKKKISESAKRRKRVARVEKISKECSCGKIISAYQHEISRGRKKFCSKDCYSSWLSLSRSKDKHWNWKGGITSEVSLIRNTKEYRIWRWAVFERDDYTCVWCRRKKEVSGKLEADHIKPFCDYPELRFAIDNGRTLCVDCHKKTDTYGGKIIKFRKKDE